MKFLLILITAIALLLSTSTVYARGKFTEKRYDKLEIGMEINEVFKRVGRSGTLVSENFSKALVENHFKNKFLIFKVDLPEGSYMVIDYKSPPYKSFFGFKYQILFVSLIFKDGSLVLKESLIKKLGEW